MSGGGGGGGNGVGGRGGRGGGGGGGRGGRGGGGKQKRPRSHSGDWEDDGSSHSTAHLTEQSASYSLVLTLLDHAVASPSLAAAIATADDGDAFAKGGRSSRRGDTDGGYGGIGSGSPEGSAASYPNGSAAANVFALLEALVMTSARLGAAAAAKAAHNPGAFWKRTAPTAADGIDGDGEDGFDLNVDPAALDLSLDGPRAVSIARAGCRLSEPELDRV